MEEGLLKWGQIIYVQQESSKPRKLLGPRKWRRLKFHTEYQAQMFHSKVFVLKELMKAEPYFVCALFVTVLCFWYVHVISSKKI